MEGASTDKLPHDSGWLTFAPTSNTKNLDADFKNPRVEFQNPNVEDERPYTLNLKNRMSPSFTTYSLPSERYNPFSLTACSLPYAKRSSQ